MTKAIRPCCAASCSAIEGIVEGQAAEPDGGGGWTSEAAPWVTTPDLTSFGAADAQRACAAALRALAKGFLSIMGAWRGAAIMATGNVPRGDPTRRRCCTMTPDVR
jgi:hypothetical protein